MAISNAQRQRVRGLQQRKFRRKYTAFLVEGRVNVLEVLSSGLEVQELYGLPELLEGFRQNASFRESLNRIEVFEVGQSELERLSTQRSPDGVLAVVQMPTYDWSTFSSAKKLLLLDGVADPGNAGTLIRTAEWFGIEGVLSLPGSVEWYNPKVVAAARGSLFRMPHLSIQLEEISNHVADHQLVVADLAGDSFGSFEWSEHSILAIGSESHGPSKELLQLSPKPITIPRAQGQLTESLNAGVAGAILLASWGK
ncbi:MAG: TrmH family RNA methyltransferase [Saprospiraceae bacterium]